MVNLWRRAWPALLLVALMMWSPAGPPVAAQTLDPADDLMAQLMIAIVQRNFDTLSSLIDEPFILALWQSEVPSLTRGEVVAELETVYFGLDADIVFNTSQDLRDLLGQDPALLLGPDVQVERTLYIKGLGSGADEAILLIAAEPGGAPRWRGMLVAPGGFRDYTPPTSTATATATLAPTNTPPPTSTPQPTSTPPPTSTPRPISTSLPPPSSASRPQRIQFAPNATSATIQGQVEPFDRNQYVLRAMAGQTMYVDLRSGGGRANFAISGVSDGQPYKRLENEARSFSFTLPRSQDYLITVGAADVGAAYTLFVSITGSTRPANTPLPVRPVRVNFAPGATSASLQGFLAPGGQNQYLLRAQAGQTMYVELEAPPSGVNFAISGVSDGQPYKRLAVASRSFSFVLPITQDYLITVAGDGAATSYSLFVSIR